MPNWCEGTLKVRGTKKNIIKFLEKGICELQHGNDAFNYIESKPNYEKDDYEMCLNVNDFENVYIKNTRRCFVTNDIHFYEYNEHLDTIDVLCIDIKQAGDIVANDFVEISKEYDLDIRIVAFENGMQFTREVEIVKGEPIIDKETSYDNLLEYCWEVYDPRLGG